MIDQNETTMFQGMDVLIHVDEKWFNLMKDRTHFNPADDEIGPLRTISHKGSY